MLITAIVNFVCVWAIKLVEEKARKDKMWKVEMAIPQDKRDFAITLLKGNEIPYNYVEVGSWVMFNCYCYHQKDTATCIKIAKNLEGRYSTYESKTAI
jgi:hypothetical protein